LTRTPDWHGKSRDSLSRNAREAMMPDTARFSVGLSQVDLSAATASDVLAAVTRDEPFPARRINFSGISLRAGAEGDIALGAENGHVRLGASGAARLQLGVFDEGSDVLDVLALQDESSGQRASASPEPMDASTQSSTASEPTAARETS
jgi:hypothetical protein